MTRVVVFSHSAKPDDLLVVTIPTKLADNLAIEYARRMLARYLTRIHPERTTPLDVKEMYCATLCTAVA